MHLFWGMDLTGGQFLRVAPLKKDNTERKNLNICYSFLKICASSVNERAQDWAPQTVKGWQKVVLVLVFSWRFVDDNKHHWCWECSHPKNLSCQGLMGRKYFIHPLKTKLKKSLKQATETTFVHFRQHNAPYGNRGDFPKNVHSVVLMNIRHCYTYQDSRELVQIVQMHHILERNNRITEWGRPEWEMKTVCCRYLHPSTYML